MARARNIKPALFKNELLGVADPLLTLLFQSLWTLADREGRIEDRPLRIKAETFPYRENLDVNGYLTELQRLGFIHRYLAGEHSVIQIVNFAKHQTPHNTEKPSTLPSLEQGIVIGKGHQEITVKEPLDLREKPIALPPDSLLLNPDSRFLIADSLIPEKRKHALRAAKSGAEAPPPDGVLLQTWEDFLLLRKAKRSPVTATAIQQIEREAVKAGLTLNDALETCCQRGWAGFKADWMRPDRANGHVNKQEALEESNRRVAEEWLAKQENQDASV